MLISDWSSDVCSSALALLLNVPAGHPVSEKPLALLAPRLAAPVIEAARHGAAAKLALRGRGGARAAQNIIGRLVRSGRPWLFVSTPRAGWRSEERRVGKEVVDRWRSRCGAVHE